MTNTIPKEIYQMREGRYYKFKSERDMESYATRHGSNRKFSKFIGTEPFEVTQIDGDGRAQTIKTSEGHIVNGMTIDAGGMVVVSCPEFQFFVECEKPEQKPVVEVNPIDPIIGLSLKDAMAIYKLMYPQSNPRNATVEKLIAAVEKYNGDLAYIEEKMEKLEKRRSAMKSVLTLA